MNHRVGRLIFTVGALIWLATAVAGSGRPAGAIAALIAIFIGLPVWAVQVARRRRRHTPTPPP